MRRYLDAARITGRKNLDGRLVAVSGAGLPFLLAEGMQVWLVPPVIDAPRCVHVSAVAEVSSREAVVSFREIADASVAELVIGCHCLVDEQDVAHVEGYGAVKASVGTYDGWHFVDERSGREGTIEGAQNVAGQVLLSVRLSDDADVYLVPMADDLLIDVNQIAQQIVMDCPVGLFDI